MEIAEYLEKSREKRTEILKTAEKLIRQSKAAPESNEKNSNYNIGPTAQKFKEYESQVNDRIKKLFNPSFDFAPLAPLHLHKSKELLVRVYSNHFGEQVKKKSKTRATNSRLTKSRHQRNCSFDIKCLFTPILSSSTNKRSGLASRNS